MTKFIFFLKGSNVANTLLEDILLRELLIAKCENLKFFKSYYLLFLVYKLKLQFLQNSIY